MADTEPVAAVQTAPPAAVVAAEVAVPDADGITAIYLTEKSLVRYGMKLGTSITDIAQFKRLRKEDLLQELADSGFMCDFYDQRDAVKVSMSYSNQVSYRRRKLKLSRSNPVYSVGAEEFVFMRALVGLCRG